MSRRLVLRDAARAEFADAALWYENQRVGLGTEFVDEVERVFDNIAGQPDRYPVVSGHVREAPVSRFPYAIYYRVRPTAVVIIAVFHCSRDPGIWQGRA